MRRLVDDLARDAAGRVSLSEDLIANAGHELKTPVGALILLGEAMSAEDDLSVLHLLARRVIDQAERMSVLIDALLNVSVQPQDPGPTVVAVADIVSDALERVRPLAHAGDVRLQLDELPGGTAICGSRWQLASALGNVLENGVKYSKEHGCVRVTVAADDLIVEIRVDDQGSGISAPDLPHIFERFYRAPSAASVEGNGLGLAIVRQIVGDHGGEVEVSSVEAVGSTFTLRLPTAASAARVGPAVRSPL